MSRRRIFAIGLALVLVLFAARLYPSVARAVAHRRAVNESRGAVARALADAVRDTASAVAIVSETADVDRFMLEAAADRTRLSIELVPREPPAVAAAVTHGLLLAGQRGRAYLEALGYQLAWLPQRAGSPSFPLARVRSRLTCATVRADAWSALPGLEFTGRLGVALPAAVNGSMVLVVGDTIPLRADVEPLDDLNLRIRHDRILAHAELPPDFWLEGGTPRDAPPHVEQLTIAASPDRTRVISIRLGRRAPRVLARLRSYADGTHANVCAAPLGPDDAFAQEPRLVLLPDMPEFFGIGWTDVLLLSGAGRVRWMDDQAAILVPSARRGRVRVELQAAPVEDLGATATVSLRVNDTTDTTRTR